MSAISGPLHVSSLLRTMAIAPPSRDRHHAAHQLTSLDPRQFLANLQAAAANRSPHAIAALKADMYELNDIFHKLSRAGHDVSAAQRDFQMLQAFVSQISIFAASQPEKKHYTSSSSSSSYHHQHHRTAPVPSSSSSPSHNIMARSRSGSSSIDHNRTSTRQAQGYQPQSQSPSTPRSSQGPVAGRSPSSTSSSSSYSSSTSSSSRNINSTAGVVCPTPHRLIKPRRASAPVVSTTTSVSTKKVHFATHATVYTIPSERERGRSSSSPTTPTVHSAASGIVPPPRPSCVPRVAGGFSADSRSRF